MCTLSPSESSLVAPGLVDTAIHEWHSAMARRYDLPYRVLSFPHDPQWMWNRQPLPYVLPEAGRSIVAPWLEHQTNSRSSAMEGAPATDSYVRDYRRRIAENLSADPNYVGNRGCTSATAASTASAGCRRRAMWRTSRRLTPARFRRCGWSGATDNRPAAFHSPRPGSRRSSLLFRPARDAIDGVVRMLFAELGDVDHPYPGSA